MIFVVLIPVMNCNAQIAFKRGLTMTAYGYARVSTNGQDLAAQEAELMAAGGLRSLSSRLCKCCYVLCAVKRGNSRRAPGLLIFHREAERYSVSMSRAGGDTCEECSRPADFVSKRSRRLSSITHAPWRKVMGVPGQRWQAARK